jgi:hypothetical protein
MTENKPGHLVIYLAPKSIYWIKRGFSGLKTKLTFEPTDLSGNDLDAVLLLTNFCYRSDRSNGSSSKMDRGSMVGILL